VDKWKDQAGSKKKKGKRGKIEEKGRKE